MKKNNLKQILSEKMKKKQISKKNNLKQIKLETVRKKNRVSKEKTLAGICDTGLCGQVMQRVG